MTNDACTTEKDCLAIELTRMSMFLGVNIRFFFCNVVLCTLVCIKAHTLWALVLFAALHLVAVRVSVKERDFFCLNVSAFVKTPPMLNRWYWGKLDSHEP